MNRALPAAPDDAAPVERRVSWLMEREEAKRVTSTRRSMIVGIVTGASMALGIVGGVVGLMKALGLLRP